MLNHVLNHLYRSIVGGEMNSVVATYKFYHSVRHIYQLMVNLKHKLMVILLLANQGNQPRAVELAPISHLQCRIIEDWT